MTDRDRLAADLNSLVATRYTTDVVDWLADRLIALGWTLRDGAYVGTVEPRIEWEIDYVELYRAAVLAIIDGEDTDA